MDKEAISISKSWYNIVLIISNNMLQVKTRKEIDYIDLSHWGLNVNTSSVKN